MEAPCQTRCQFLSMTDSLFSSRSPNSATFSRVPSPVLPGAVEVPVAIAPKPTTPDTAPIFSSPRRSMARRLHSIYPLQQPSVKRKVRSLSSVSFSPCPCGHSAQYKELRSKTLLTVLGAVELSRPYYLCAHCTKGQYPVDAELGV